MEEQLEQAQLELIQASKLAQDKTVDLLIVNAKLKCYELAIEHVKATNHSGSTSSLMVNSEIKKEFQNLLKTVGLD